MEVEQRMKQGTWMWAAAAAALVAGALGASALVRAQENGAEARSLHAGAELPADAPKRCGVDALSKTPEAFEGQVVLEGVVARVLASRRTFTLIDTKELASCGVTSCAEYSVAVQVPEPDYKGALPQERDVALVLGEIVPLEKGYHFYVSEVRVDSKPVISRLDFSPGALLEQRSELKLSDEQVKRLEALEADLATEEARIRSGREHCEAELRELLEESPADEAKLAHGRAEIRKLKTDWYATLRTFAADARGVLSPQQLDTITKAR